MIIKFLPDSEKISISKVNKDFYRYIKSSITSQPCFYYAVGSNVDLDEYQGELKLRQTLDKNTILFHEYHIAQKYAYLRQVNTYCSNLDAFLPISGPSVFIAQLLPDGPYKKIATTIQVQEHIPDCPMPPSANKIIVSGFKAPTSNVKMFFSNFNGSLFNHNKANYGLLAVWSKGVSAEHELQQSAVSGVLAVFNSYFTCYSTLTRHNQVLVSKIIDKALQHPSIEDLYNFIISAYQSGISNTTINKNGKYMQMLRFVSVQLNMLRKIDQLPGINDYMKQNPLRDF
jgi:hypothetical protein